MKKYHNHLKVILLFTISMITLIFLTLQYQKINAEYYNTREISIVKNKKITANNVEFKVVDIFSDRDSIIVTLNIKQTGPGFYGMKSSDNFYENMWIASPYVFSQHYNKAITDQDNRKFDMKKYADGKEMTAKVSFRNNKALENGKFYFLVSNNKSMIKYALPLKKGTVRN
ncbi:hypothetical protein [Companilactobacillus baiquanensis]|uniref:DUF5067 domain-containing protein n=1 Tax=Companilactobacillus baiquanensis TaxID=2486005 RepID=A0ABW1URU5_9LACO|nr:hypothetical protein [Companilactobacillus baiquanensis]